MKEAAQPIRVNVPAAKAIMIALLQAKLVPMLEGSPGCGKSDIVHQLAAEYNLKVIDIRLSQCDPTDLLGFPNIDRETGRASYYPMDIFPLEGDEIPEGYDGWLVFLDEIKNAEASVQKAAYKLILDEMVGQHPLHKRCAMICAGNLDTDNAMVEELPTPLRSRVVHLELESDVDAWMKWAMANDIHHHITSYIKWKPNNLYTFSPDHTDKTYAAPRTWEFANRLLTKMPLDSPYIVPALAGTIGEGVAREFISFTKIYKQLPSLQEIVSNPAGATVPTEPSVNFALTGALASNANPDNLRQIVKYLDRIPPEFRTVCLMELINRNAGDPEMTNHDAINDWVAENAAELF